MHWHFLQIYIYTCTWYNVDSIFWSIVCVVVSEELKLSVDMNGCNQQAWAVTSCNLIGKGQWDSARFAYHQYLDQVNMHKPFGRYHVVKVNLQPLCDLDQIVKEKWVMELIRFFLMMRGDDYRTLSIERGDSYFHAVVRMTLVTSKELHS